MCEERYAFEPGDGSWNDGLFALIREDEGQTAIRIHEDGQWARITLEVHSSLDAVGFTAAFASCLAAAGIGANVVAALDHDHLFLPWEQREEALEALRGLSTAA